MSAKESEPHSGKDWLERRKFSAFWRNGCFGFWEAAMAEAPAAADAAKNAAVVAEKGREVELLGWGGGLGFGG